MCTAIGLALAKIGWGGTRKMPIDARARSNSTLLHVKTARAQPRGRLVRITLANGGAVVTEDGVIIGV